MAFPAGGGFESVLPHDFATGAARDLPLAFKCGWKTLLFVHLAVAIIAGTVAATLATGVILGVVSLSGEAALSDTAIAAFAINH